jgi:hypothetical protein
MYERWYPYGFGIAVGIGVFSVRELFSLPDTLKELFPVVISISAIAVGFLATAKSILLSLDERPVVRHLKQLGGYDVLVWYLLTAVNWSLIASLVSALFLLFMNNRDTWLYRDAFAVWAAITTIAILTCYRVIRLFARILISGSKMTERTPSVSLSAIMVPKQPDTP